MLGGGAVFFPSARDAADTDPAQQAAARPSRLRRPVCIGI
jgi:hypothetical protein